MLLVAPSPQTSFEPGQSSQTFELGLPEMPKDLKSTIEEKITVNDEEAKEQKYQVVRCPANRLTQKLRADAPMSKNGKHLVLDLDETLIHTFESGVELDRFVENLENKNRLKNFTLPGLSNTFWTYARPHLETFLRGVFEEFDSVGVWSAGAYDYVHTIVKMVFPSDLKPAYIMTRNDCNEMRFVPGESICRFKPLENVYQRMSKWGLNERNTIIVDDRKDICAINCLNNVQIPAFYMHSENYSEAEEDASLLILLEWFKSQNFRKAKDVTYLKGKSPFRER